MRVVFWSVTVLFIQTAVVPMPASVYAAVGVHAGPEASEASEPSLVRLDDLLDDALAHNPELVAARTRWEAAKQKIPLAKGLPAPRIGVEWEEIPRGSVKFNQAELMYQLIQSLPFPGKLSAKHQVAVKDAQVAAMAFKQAEWEVLSQVKAVYYDLFLVDRELELQRQRLLWVTQAASAAQARYATGAAPQAEVLRAQGEVLLAGNMLEVLAHRRLAMTAHVNHLLNRPADRAIGRPAMLVLTDIPLTPEELLLTAEAQQPELLAFKFSAERADAALTLAKRELLPDLETMIELRDPAMGPFGPWDLSLALVLPFWFWTKMKYGVKAAVYDRTSAHAAYEAMHNEIARRIYEHWHQAEASYTTAKLCRDGLIPLSQQAVASAMAAYQGGRTSFLDLLDAVQQLTERKRLYYQQLVDVEQHLVMLEQAAGVSLRAPLPAAMVGGAS